ncbi:MAG: nucleoside phosphorylase [Muribaculaceae bacterium]|nr:nucleoside phosphorylase [Muribaculaceae bacterium]
MNKKFIPDSELIINEDGSVFHLHLLPEQLQDNIIICGDPGRVNMIASYFDTQDYEVQSREFHTIGGTYKGKPVMALSHGIGGDNIDIVITELDALANIDFATRTERDEHRTLNIVRIGTSGGLQPYVPVGTQVIASKAIGFDGVLNYYRGRNEVCDLDFEREFCEHVRWNKQFAAPYVIEADPTLVNQLDRGDMVRGYTISAVGFYGPQGREVRVPLAEPELNSRIETFEYAGGHITNYEMESAALQGLARLMGHRAVTICSIIANRVATTVNPNYKTAVNDLIGIVLDRLLD